MLSPSTQRKSLAHLADACRLEASRFRAGEPGCGGFCFELVRRAVCERDDRAWEAVIGQYRGLVLSWVRQHPASQSLAEADDYWVGSVFERFWMAVGPERFAGFRNVGAVAQYLKMCVHSVLVDEVRASRASLTEALDDQQDECEGCPDVEGLFMTEANGRELWRTIELALPDEDARLAIYLSFALDLKPREIHARCPERFGSTADVYRIKRNALDRLRRDVALRAEYAYA